jgi:hypothetical protein
VRAIAPAILWLTAIPDCGRLWPISQEGKTTFLNSDALANKPFLLPVVCESGGMADAQGSGPCERKLVGVQVPPLAPSNRRLPASCAPIYPGEPSAPISDLLACFTIVNRYMNLLKMQI